MSTSSAAVRSPDQWAVFWSLAIRFFRHGAGTFGAAIAIMCGLPALMYGMIWMLDASTVRHFDGDVFTMVFRIGEWIALPAFLMYEVIQIRPLYVLPITNRQIVNIQLALGVAAIIALHLFCVAFYAIVFRASFPVWEPLLFFCPAIVAATGLSSLLVDFRWWRPFVVAIVVGSVVALVGFPRFHEISIFHWRDVNFRSAWLVPNIAELLVIAVFAAVGYRLTLRGVERDRCGELRSWPDLDALLQQFAARLSRLWTAPIPAGRFRSGVSAQFWFEFWQKGLIVPIIAAFFGGVGLIGAYHGASDWLVGFVMGFPSMLIGAMLIAGVLVGLVNVGQRGTTISEYRATRPLTDAQLAHAALKAALASVAMTCLVLVVYFLIVGIWSPGAMIRSLAQPDAFRNLTVAIVVGWMLLGGVASIVVTGRIWVTLLPWGLLFLGLAGNALLQRIFPDPEFLDQIAQLTGWVLMLAMVLGTLAAYVYAMRRGKISGMTVGTGVALAIVAAIVFVQYHPPTLHTPDEIALRVAWALIATAPLATAPLALSWNRHR